VQDLHLRIGRPYADDPDNAHYYPEIVSALAACGGSLRSVRLYLQFFEDVRFPAVLATALSGVSRLRMEVEEGELTLDVPMSGMSRLQGLYLRATPVDYPGQSLAVTPLASLPASLTKLHLGGLGWGQEEGDKLPPQVPGRVNGEVQCLALPCHGLA